MAAMRKDGTYPYAERYGVIDRFPDEGRPREEISRQLREMAEQEDAAWKGGKCSGTMYAGDFDHFAFINDAYGLFCHVNTLQRDMCPSATRFEGEIIAMTLDLLHADAARPEASPCGSLTSGGTESILSALLAHRDKYRAERGVTQPEIILPETAHVAFEKGAHLFGIDVVHAPIDPVTTEVDVDFVRDHITPRTITLVGSAGNYGYGTVDPIGRLSELAVEHGIGLHVDGCLGGFILPWGEELGYDVPVFDFRLPGVTSISADTHKFGYGPKGTSVVLYRDRSLRQYQYFMRQEWSGGKYISPGIAGSRSGGLLAATWAAMVSLGRRGYLHHAKRIFETSFAMQEAVRSHRELRLMGRPTFCFSFTSNVFNIYHLNDAMKERGWRLNGQQHPDAVHMCVTRPQTRPGLVDEFARDLAAAVDYAKKPAREKPVTGAVYGGLPKGVPEIREFVRGVMVGMLDAYQDVPR